MERVIAGMLAPPPTLTRPATPIRASAYQQERAAASYSKPAGGVEKRILDALAELEQLGARRPARELVAFLAGYSNLASKGFVHAVSALRTAGAIDYPDAGTVALTEAGRLRARPPERPRTPEEVQARVIAMLGGASGRILTPLIAAYPEAVKRVDVADAAGYSNLASKGFVHAISRLRSLGFVDYPDAGSIVALPVLFLEGQ
jgi:CRP-like cAMP-binding protein